MPEPVSIGACFISYVALTAYSRFGNAVSSEAQKVRAAATAVVESAENSQVLFGNKVFFVSELRKLADECSAHDWDGNGASPILLEVVLLAENFVWALPAEIPFPEFAPEPDGGISLDWIVARTRIFSLSVGRTNRLAYAWLDGTDKGHAVARFDGLNIPLRIVEGIRSILSYAHSSVWVD